MKGSSAKFSFITLCVALSTCVSIKQNLGYAKLLRPHVLGKLICHVISLSIKQNIGHAWLLRPHALGKLILHVISLSVKQNLGHAWLLKPHALGKFFHYLFKY